MKKFNSKITNKANHLKLATIYISSIHSPFKETVTYTSHKSRKVNASVHKNVTSTPAKQEKIISFSSGSVSFPEKLMKFSCIS